MKRRSFLVVSLFASIFLFYAWVFVWATSYELPSPQHSLIFYSNQTRHDLKNLFYRAFQSATSSIYLRMYGVTDRDLLAVLERRAASGIKTIVEYDKTASCSLPHTYRSIKAHPLKLKGLMHRKILIIDDALVFLGSANLTPSSLKHHDNLVMGLYHPSLAQFLQGHPNDSFSFDLEGAHAELRLLPDPKNQTLPQLLTWIDQASSSIYIAIFTLTHPEISDALIRAKKRGVDVRIAIDRYTALGASRKAVRKLQENHIAIYQSLGQQLLHHKWALIDKNKLIVGSANWTKAAFQKNEDFLLFLSQLSEKQQKFMHKLWDIIETEADGKSG